MDQEIKEGRGCGPNKDYIPAEAGPPGRDTIHKRLPSVYEIGVNFANVDITKEPIPVVPTIHYQMGGIPTNITARSWCRKNGNEQPWSTACTRGRMRLRERARRQPPGHQLAAGPAGVRQAAGNHIVANNKTRTHKPGLPADAADRRWRLNQAWTTRRHTTRRTWLATSASPCSSTPACSARRPAWTKAWKIAADARTAWQRHAEGQVQGSNTAPHRKRWRWTT